MEKKENKSLDKIVKTRKKLANVINKASISRDVIDEQVRSKILDTMINHRIMIDHSVKYCKTETTMSNGMVIKQYVTMTVAYTVIDVDSCDSYGPIDVTTTTIGSIYDFGLSHDINDWAALLTIFDLLPETEMK